MEVEEVELEPQMVLGIRKRGAYKEIANLIPKVCEYAIRNGVQITGPPIFICHEMPGEAMEANKNEDADIEVAIPIEKEAKVSGEIKFYQIAGGKMAKIIHKGLYQDCGPAYEKLFKWVEENGKQITGPTREVYINDPREIPPNEIITEIYAPIS